MKIKFKELFIKSIILFVLSLFALIIVATTNVLKRNFIFPKGFIIAFIIIFLIFSIIMMILSIFKNVDGKKFVFIDYFTFIGQVLAFGFIIVSIFISPIKVSGDSMEKTYHDGQLLFISKINKLAQDDIAIFYLSDDNLSNLSSYERENIKDELLIKRVVAIPGDRVTVDFGKIKINDDNYLAGSAKNAAFLKDLDNGVVPDGYILCLGDNRSVSVDSRAFGLVPIKNVIGYVV